MSVPLYAVAIVALACLLLGACIGVWIANQDLREDELPARIAGPGMPTEEDEAVSLTEADIERINARRNDVEYLRKRGWL